MSLTPYVINLDQVGIQDIETVGGKNASLGEMISNLTSLGVNVPGGFAITVAAYNEFLKTDGLDQRIYAVLDNLDVDNIEALTAAGENIRKWIASTELPQDLVKEISDAWHTMAAGNDIAVAVRSSATAEDLPDASFAGQQETFLNIRGLGCLYDAIQQVFKSLFNDRAIAYRAHQGYEHSEVSLSVGIQHMIRSDIGSAGVAFTLDTETGFRDAVFITSAYGLGEAVVQGSVNPDEFYIYKPALKNGNDPILRKNLGSKLTKMVYSDDSNVGKTIKTGVKHLAKNIGKKLFTKKTREVSSSTPLNNYQSPSGNQYFSNREDFQRLQNDITGAVQNVANQRTGSKKAKAKEKFDIGMNKAKTTASNAFTKPLGNYTVSVDDLAMKASKGFGVSSAIEPRYLGKNKDLKDS